MVHSLQVRRRAAEPEEGLPQARPMQAESLSEEAEELCQFIQQKLQNWQRLGEAPEYYALRNRGPYKPTVVHERVGPG